jgi:hypothetical protein
MSSAEITPLEEAKTHRSSQGSHVDAAQDFPPDALVFERLEVCLPVLDAVDVGEDLFRNESDALIRFYS